MRSQCGDSSPSAQNDAVRQGISVRIQQKHGLEDTAVPAPRQLADNRLPQPRRIALTGFMGAGKSTVGVRLAQELSWEFIDLDQQIVRAEQKSIAEIFETEGESRFREIERRALTNILLRSDIVLALGGGALETAANRRLLAEDPETWLLYLEAPLEVLMARCAGEQPHSPRRPVFENRPELAGRFERRKPFYETAAWTIRTANLDPDDIVQMVLDRWKEHWGNQP